MSHLGKSRPFSFDRAARTIAALCIGGAIALVPAGVAHAHASLASSVPAAGETVAQSPAEITLTFNETVTSDAKEIQLLDSDGSPVPAAVAFTQQNIPGAAGKEGQERGMQRETVATITPGVPLHDGPWVVSWSAVSEDGHLVSGVVDFSVAAQAQQEPSASGGGGGAGEHRQGADTRSRAAEVPSRVLEGLGWLAAVAAGMLLAGSSARTLIMSLAASGCIAAALYTWSVAGALQDASLALRVGEVRAGLAVAACGAVAAAGASLGSRKLQLACATLSLGAFSAQGLWSGHHLSLSLWPVTLAHVAHLAAAAAWTGAVVALAARRDIPQARRTRRQSTAAIVVLIPAGAVLAAWASGLAGGTFSPGTWSVVLAVKVTAVAVALTLGLVNHRSLSENRIESTVTSPARLTRFVSIEVVALALAAAASATLTLYTPSLETSAASGPAAGAEAGPEAGASAPCAEALVWPEQASLLLADGTHATLAVAPPRRGPSATVSLDMPSQGIEGDVTLVATHSSGASSTIYLEPSRGTFSGTARLPLEGHWMLQAEVPLDAFTAETATGHLDIALDGCASGSSEPPRPGT